MSLGKVLYAIGITVFVAFLAGCNTQNSSENNAATTPASQSLSIDLSLSSLYSGISSKSTASKTVAAVSSVLTGELQAINYTTNKITNYDWSATLDEATLSVQSIKTLTLEPGSYRFTLLLSNTSYQYAGNSYATITDGNTSDIPMTLAPVIGDSVINVSAISTLSDYHFTYSASDLVSINTPKLGISIDGGLEQIFTINKITGLTDSYINLPDGLHTIKLALYENTNQVGRSVIEQENVTIIAGSPLTMDIVPLHAETAFTFSTIGGSATVKTIIPSEILAIADILDLDVLLTLTDGGTSYEKSMSLYTENNITYGITSFGSVTSDPLTFGDYAMQLLFLDSTNPSIPIGSCLMDNISLDTNSSTLECSVSVSNPSIANGGILASVGINVYDISSLPVAGATIYANGKLIGITGSGVFGTEGFLAVDLPAGDTILKAETNTSRGEVSTTLNPLDIRNFDIIVSENNGTASIFDLFHDGSAIATIPFDVDGRDLGGIHNAHLINGAAIGSAKIDNGLVIDSNESYVEINTSLPYLQHYSISLFVQIDTTFHYGNILAFDGNNDISIEFINNKYVFGHMQSSGIGPLAESNTTFTTGEMHHIVATADGTFLRLYVDGLLEASTAYDGTTLPGNTYDSMGSLFFTGKIDQVRIFNRAVTQDEILQLINEY